MNAEVQHIENIIENSDENHDGTQLQTAVKNSIKRYFAELDGSVPQDVYQMVLLQMEKPLFEAILKETRGNQSKASEYLGLNRGTLRKKLRLHDLL